MNQPKIICIYYWSYGLFTLNIISISMYILYYAIFIQLHYLIVIIIVDCGKTPTEHLFAF